jgi:hypothetical protein
MLLYSRPHTLCDATQERADIDQEGELPQGNYNATLVSESTHIVLANVEAARRQGAHMLLLLADMLLILADMLY